MTTQQEKMRRILNLLEDIESPKKDPTSSLENEKAAEHLLDVVGAISESLSEQQLTELDWKKMTAAGAFSIAALTSSLANAGGLDLLDTTNNGTTVMSCSAVMTVAANYPGFSPQQQAQIQQVADMYQTVGSKWIKQDQQNGNMARAQQSNAAFQHTADSSLRLVKQSGNWKPVLDSASACAQYAAKLTK